MGKEGCNWCIQRCLPGEEICHPDGFGSIVIEEARMIPLMNDPVITQSTPVLAVAPNDCMVKCLYCFNKPTWQGESVVRMDADQVVRLANSKEIKVLTTDFTEAVTWRDYLLDLFQKAHESGLRVVFSTSGVATPEAMGKLMPHFDVLRVDLKGATDDQYYKVAPGFCNLPVLETVLANIRLAKAAGKHVEVTTCVIPKFNDDEPSLTRMAQMIIDSAGRQTAWTLIPFKPLIPRQIANPDTPSLSDALEIGKMADLNMFVLKL